MNYKLLIITIAVVVFAIIGVSLWTGIEMREVTVVEHPYDEGLKYDATQKKYAELGWRVVTPSSANKDGQLTVWVYDKNGVPMDGASVEFAINRIAGHEIKKYRAAQTERGRYGASVDFYSKGCWEIKVNVTHGTDTLSYDNKIQIDG
jgi:nitrogen fixation protein FixH